MMLWLCSAALSLLPDIAESKVFLRNTSSILLEVNPAQVKFFCEDGRIAGLEVKDGGKLYSFVFRGVFEQSSHCSKTKQEYEVFIRQAHKVHIAGMDAHISSIDGSFFSYFEWITDERNKCKSYFLGRKCIQSELEGLMSPGKPL